MAYKSTQDWVQSEKNRIEKATTERKEEADALVEQKKEEIGYSKMSDEQKKVADEALDKYHDHLMGKNNPNEEKKDSSEEDDHDEREFER